MRLRSGSEDLAPAAVGERLAALGPYFAVAFHGGSDAAQETVRGVGGRSADSLSGGGSAQQPEPAQPESPWRPLAELVEDPAVLADRVAAVRAYLAAGTGQAAEAVELRVAASVVHLGLAARVVSPLFALAVGYRRCGVVRAADLRWQPGLPSTFPLSVPESVLDGVDLADGVLGGVVAELETAVARFGVNQHILRGNVASALAGAAKTLAAGWPELRGSAAAFLGTLLATPLLADSAELEPDGTLRTFRRRSCCLIYRAAPDHDGALCGDCVLAQTGR